MCLLLHHQLLRPLLLLALVFAALLPTNATAQAHTLFVSIQDLGGRGVAGISVIVRTESGDELARQTTDARGVAAFAELPAVVRVAVAGQARGGPSLYQLGEDARGVRLELSRAIEGSSLALRVERDGLVLPDPATMGDKDSSVAAEAAAVSTAAAATPVRPAPTAPPEPAPVVKVGEVPAPAEQRRADWVPGVTLLLVVAAMGLLRLVQKLRGGR